FLNPLYIALDKVPCLKVSVEQPIPEHGAFVDYAAVATYKNDLLRMMWRDWPSACAENEDMAKDFDRFRLERGETLRLHALFEAISRQMVQDGHGAEWTTWPQEFRSAGSLAVADFQREQSDEVVFYEWLQWLADRQLADAARRARNAGMRIGRYLDMAVGEAPGGSGTWSRPTDFVRDATVGAPPDYFSAEGHGWGVAGFSPLALWQQNLKPFLDLVRG